MECTPEYYEVKIAEQERRLALAGAMVYAMMYDHEWGVHGKRVTANQIEWLQWALGGDE
jgi:hypothetical protein